MNVLIDGDIVLHGDVGDLYWGDSFTSTDVILALAEVGREANVTVRINSGGGIATEGAAIYAALAAHGGNVTVIVEGIAASAASLIAMAGDEIIMRKGAIMMIHDPSGVTIGDVAEHEKQIESLNALATAYASIYADQTGATPEQARADMVDEIWLTPEEAVERGYADRVDDKPAAQPTAFNYRIYAHAPPPMLALADQRGAPKKRTRMKARMSAATTANQETDMAKEPADENAAKAKQDEINAAVTAAVDSHKATSIAKTDAAEIVKACNAAGVPQMAADLLVEGVTIAVAQERIGMAQRMKDLVTSARKKDTTIPENQAEVFLKAGKTVDQARAELFDRIVAKEEETTINSHVAPGDKNGREMTKASMAALIKPKAA